MDPELAQAQWAIEERLLSIFNTIEPRTYWLPDHWAPALFNDDSTGLEDEDLEQLEAFLKGENLGAPIGFEESEGEEPAFMRYHDAQPYGVLATDCLPYLFAST
jgi:hypothetical protein